LGAILHEKSVKEAMLWGAASSAAVIQKVGATAGLLQEEELAKRVGAAVPEKEEKKDRDSLYTILSKTIEKLKLV